MVTIKLNFVSWSNAFFHGGMEIRCDDTTVLYCFYVSTILNLTKEEVTVWYGMQCNLTIDRLEAKILEKPYVAHDLN
jgi:hypothetical protein